MGTSTYKVNGIQKVQAVNYFDTCRRLYRKETTFTSHPITKTLTYNKTRVSSAADIFRSNNLGTNNYGYDDMGRIQSDSYSCAYTSGDYRTYEYDEYGQLVRENNQGLDKTYVYEYNDIGNLTSVKAYDYTLSEELTGTPVTTTFGYTNDRLTSFGGATIGYNTMGCPTSYEGKTATWSKGRLSRLTQGALTTGMDSYAYTYNGYGQRIARNYTYTQKSSGLESVQVGQLTAYTRSYKYDHAGRLIAEDVTKTHYGEGTTTENIVFLYDESGIIGMELTAGGTTNLYYFQRNLQGDVVAIYDANGVLKAKYLYDAWGNCTISSETTSYDVANANPIRYRGYYYDDDTGLYFCNARYYSPKWRRFISPDDTAYLDPESVNGLNLYCYCNNDPVNYCDPSGHDWDWGSFWRGAGYLVTGIGAIVAGALVIASGVATIPMLIIAGVTIGAGALTSINGVSEVVEAGTGYNFVEDTVFRGNTTAYDTYATVAGSIATVGSLICGGWYRYNTPRIRAYKSLGTYNVKNKHLLGAGGNWNKFSSADQAYLRSLGRYAIKNTPMRYLSWNSSDSYRLVFDLGYTIGTKGETSIRLVFSVLGKIITFFPQ